jgi:hypothetical protein
MKIIRLSETTYFLSMFGKYDPPEHDKVQIDNSLPVGEIEEVETEWESQGATAVC